MVLGFACLWFGALVPVHQRGQIQLPGASASAVGASHCSRPDAPCHKKDTKPGQAPKDPGNCAVCHFILGLHAPPPVTAYEARLGLVELLSPERPIVAPLRHVALPFHGLDPPTV
jgi:hypothetical protein